MMFAGMIQGEYISVTPNQRIELKWKFKDWPAFALCCVTFAESGSKHDITVRFTEIPEYDSFGGYVNLEGLKNGWRENIFKKIH